MPRMTAAERYQARQRRKVDHAAALELARLRQQADSDWFWTNIAPNLERWRQIVEEHNRPWRGVV